MQRKSIYKYASEAGLPAGLYLTLMSACILMSIKLPFLPVLVVPLMLGFPFVLWKLLKNIVEAEPGYRKFASVWLGGIYTVIFGTIICLFLSALYIVFVEPGFVYQYVTNAIAAVENSGMADQYANTIILMKEAIELHLLPTGIEFITTMAWFTCFCGSILSLLLAVFMTKTSRKSESQIAGANN